MNDEKLIERLKDGDAVAFGMLYERHSAACRKFAALNVGASMADDVVQDVFGKLWSGRDRLEACETLRPYLMRAVYNCSLNAFRAKNSSDNFRNEYSRKLEAAAAVMFDPDNNDTIKTLFSKEDGDAIERAICGLPDRCQEIFRLSYIDGLSHKEIAGKLGISTSTVDNQVFKALKILRDALSINAFGTLFLLSVLEKFQ